MPIMHDGRLLGRIEPQPPSGIKYMLGGETWLAPEKRSPVRLECEEWRSLGPMLLRPDVEPNEAGFPVRSITIPAPEGALGFTEVDGVYYWTDRDIYGRTATEREAEGSQIQQAE